VQFCGELPHPERTMRAGVVGVALVALCVAPAAAAKGTLDPKDCPLLPEHQKFKEPQVTTSDNVTLGVETLTLCSPVSGRFWVTRAYSCLSCKDKSPSVPGVTMVTKPGTDLFITLKNKLRHPDPDQYENQESWAQTYQSPAKKHQNDHIKNLGDLNTTNLHTHGLHTSPRVRKKIKGVKYLPDTIFTEVHPGKTAKYMFNVRSDHQGGTHWYHPHRHHATSAQAGGGLHGALIVDEPQGGVPPQMRGMPTFLVVISLVDLRPFRLLDSAPDNSLGGIGTLEEQGGGHLWKNLKGPEKGRYVKENNVFALVNGMFRPQLELTTGHWYRFRMIFASVEMFIESRVDSKSGLQCEMQLLAKDGIWLHVAPRKIDRIYLASGNRADVAIKCECTRSTRCDGGLYALDTDPTFDQDLSARQREIDATIHPSEGINTDPVIQELIKFIFTRPRTGEPQGPIKAFTVRRPCYLADLRNVDVPMKNWGRLDFWSPMDDPGAGWKVTWSDWYHRFRGQQMYNLSNPALFELEVGEVYQLLVRGPVAKKGGIAQHPFHLHTIPYQITSLTTQDPYYMVGDWHDVLLHPAGQAEVKIQTDSYTGRYIIHCHILTHEDYGMMSYFDLKGKEGKTWEGAEQADPMCYREGGKPGWSYASETSTQAAGRVPSEPHWVKGPPGVDCIRTCSRFGGCNGLGWPESLQELQKIALATGNPCAPTTRHQAAAENPTYLFDGTCNYKFKPYFQSQRVKAGTYRCGKTPPPNVARFCPCNKAPRASTTETHFV